MARRKLLRRRLRTIARKYRLSLRQKKMTGQVMVVLLALMCLWGLGISIFEKVHG